MNEWLNNWSYVCDEQEYLNLPSDFIITAHSTGVRVLDWF